MNFIANLLHSSVYQLDLYLCSKNVLNYISQGNKSRLKWTWEISYFLHRLSYFALDIVSNEDAVFINALDIIYTNIWLMSKPYNLLNVKTSVNHTQSVTTYPHILNVSKSSPKRNFYWWLLVDKIFGYELDSPGLILVVDEIFRPSSSALGPTQPPVKWVLIFSRG